MFDPYRKWLGIPPGQRPPTHYQLLGIAAEETDLEVIEEAALGRTAHLRTYQTGPHAQECAKLLNEIAQAKLVLRDPPKRREYDAGLAKARDDAKEAVARANRKLLDGPPGSELLPVQPFDLAAPTEWRKTKRRQRSNASSRVVFVLIGVGAIASAVLGTVLLSSAGKNAANERAHVPAGSQQARSSPPPSSPTHSAKNLNPLSTHTAETRSSAPSQADDGKSVASPAARPSLSSAPSTPAPPYVVAVWRHKPGSNPAGEISLYSNGKINQPEGPNTWSLMGNTLILTWLNRAAPNGKWVDTCTLSQDRKSYQGKNQNGVPIGGQLVNGGI
jgi:hypothetical protein